MKNNLRRTVVTALLAALVLFGGTATTALADAPSSPAYLMADGNIPEDPDVG